jgi:hypothetical protein
MFGTVWRVVIRQIDLAIGRTDGDSSPAVARNHIGVIVGKDLVRALLWVGGVRQMSPYLRTAAGPCLRTRTYGHGLDPSIGCCHSGGANICRCRPA